MIYMFLATGFEEIEALCPLDIMRRAGLDVKTVGVGGNEILGAHGICVKADITDEEFDAIKEKNIDMVFLPGGMPGTLNLAASKTVTEAINDAFKSQSYIAAICAAPSILGDMGLLMDKEAICYPGFEDRLKGAKISKNKIVRDGNIITAAGMGVAYGMGLLLVEILCGKEKADHLRSITVHE